MKKVWIVNLLLLALCLSLVACGGSKSNPDTVNYTTVEGKLTALGFNEQDLLTNEQDTLSLDGDGDLILHSAASAEEAAKAVYDACAKAADDGIVRNHESKEPMEFSFEESKLYFGYMRGDTFRYVAFSPIWSDQETGITDYLLQWD